MFLKQHQTASLVSTRRLIVTLLMLLPIVSACSRTLPLMTHHFDNDGNAYAHAASLRTSVIEVVQGGGNLGRLAAVHKRAGELGLDKRLRFEAIDWFSLQKNMIIDIPGESPSMIYVVAHYDKTDASLLKLPSLLLNGAFDELLSFSYVSDGAIDNATGVAVALELAADLDRMKPHYHYRFLFAGAEESGLRGSRAHISRLSEEERAAVEMAVNIDTVGVVFSRNCVTNDIGDPALLEQVVNVARELNADLGQESDIVTDYIPFKGTDAWHDIMLGFQFNYVGGLLPQRSWFTDPFSVPVVNFTACGLTEDPWSDLVSMLFFPIGKMHGIRDRLDQVDIPRLYEQFQIAREFLGIRDRRAAEQALIFSQQ
jgi:hypothetical protein